MESKAQIEQDQPRPSGIIRTPIKDINLEELQKKKIPYSEKYWKKIQIKVGG